LHSSRIAGAAARAGEIGGLAAPAVGTGIGLGADEGPGPLHDLVDAQDELLGRDRLGQEFCDTCVARLPPFAAR